MLKKTLFKVAGLTLAMGLGIGFSPGLERDKRSEQTFDTVNVYAADVTVDAPTMSHKTGVYNDPFDLTFTTTEGTVVYYTLDGSNPKTSTTRKVYDGFISIDDRTGDPNYVSAVDPVEFDCANATYSGGKMGDRYSAPADEDVDKATVVRAVAMDGEGNYSDVVTNTYFVGSITSHIEGIKESAQAAGIPVSIMSISVNYEDLFDYETGIYVKGKIFDEAFANVPNSEKNSNIVDATRKLPANYNQKGKEWEREAHIDYLESDGTTTTCELQQDCGIRIQGNYSRSDLQKSFRLYARKEYGNKNFKYEFFGDKCKNDAGETMDKFKKLVLRNGGNGAFYGKYRDAYWQSLLTELSCDTQASRVCVVYLDGEYWGVYVLQEDLGDDYAEDHHDVNKDFVVTIKGDAEKNECGFEMDDGTLPAGVTDETYYMHELLNFFETHDNCFAQKDYDELAALIDPVTTMDYFIAEIYINNKWDWPGKNWYIWKTTEGYDGSNEYTDGRWRFAYCDMDFGAWSGGNEINANTISSDKLLNRDSENPIVLVFSYFMTNENFRNEFIEKYQEYTTTVFESSLCEERAYLFDGTYRPLMSQFYRRFMSMTANGRENIDGKMGVENNLPRDLINFTKWRARATTSMVNYINNALKEFTAENQQTENPSGEDTSSEDTLKEEGGNNITEEVVAPKKGAQVKDKKYIYKVVTAAGADGKLGTLQVTGLKKKSLTTIKIAAIVTIDGYKYKVVSIAKNAFKNNKKVKKAFIGKNVKTIGNSAFASCKNLKQVSINSTVLKTIGKSAFAKDKKLTKIIIKSKKLKKVGKNALKGVKKSCKIKAPKGKKKAYLKLFGR